LCNVPYIVYYAILFAIKGLELQVFSHVDYSVCSQLRTFFYAFDERKKVTDINKAICMCRIKITISCNLLGNVLHYIYPDI